MATTSMGKQPAEKAPEPKPEPKPEPTPAEVLSGDIDSRMAALLKDHQRMGARPK